MGVVSQKWVQLSNNKKRNSACRTLKAGRAHHNSRTPDKIASCPVKPAIRPGIIQLTVDGKRRDSQKDQPILNPHSDPELVT